ncbi:hypothetical protein D6T65_05060 [Arthrobacter frigidicola]|nr:hypothetical protein D6T65_05060 [Arthrobacter frigidicola]
MITDLVTSLRLNVDELCETHMDSAETAYSVDGQAIIERNTGMVPGLIAQLRESAAGGQSGGSGGSAQNARSPIAVGMWSLLNEITIAAEGESIRLRMGIYDGPERNIRAWANAAQQFPHEVEKCLAQTDKWIEQINELLNPPRRWEINHPCPNCQERFVIRQVDGEPTKTAALTVTKDEAACRACNATWPPTDYQALAEHMGIVT